MNDFVKAVDLGDLEKLKVLSSSIEDINTVIDEEGKNLLMRACDKLPILNNHERQILKNKRAQIAAYLIEKGIRINEQKDGKTAAHLAAFQGNVDIIRSLLAAKADFNMKTDYPLRLTPLEIALSDERDSILFSEHSQIALDILEANAQKDLNNRNNFFGLSPFLMSIQKGDFNVASYMLKNREKLNLDVNTVSSENANASLFCVSKALQFRPQNKKEVSVIYQSYLSLFKELTEAGVDYQQSDRDGDSALSFIEGYRMADFMKALRQKVKTAPILQSLIKLREINNIRY